MKMKFRGKLKEKPSERKREAVRANARQPRTRPLPEERELRQLARLGMMQFLCTDAKDRLIRIMRGKSDEHFLLAFRLAADKFGLPNISEQTITIESGSQPIVFEFKHFPKPGSDVTV